MGFLIVLIAACITAEFFWWVAGIATVGLLIWIGRRTFKAAAAEMAAEAAAARATIARADEQHAQIPQSCCRP